MDITTEFFEASKELGLGEIVKCENFNLVDAMSAIQLMDPKMDMGVQPLDETLGLDYAIKNGKIDVCDVNLKDLISVIDATFAMIMSWLNGQPLDQTVFTNICLLDVDKVKDPVMAGFCSATLNFVHSIKLCIEQAGVFNEEDFSSYSCFLDVAVSFRCPFDELDMVIEILRMKKLSLDLELVKAVECRLCLLQSTFDLFSYLLPSSSTSSPDLDKASSALERALCFVSITLQTVNLGVQPPSSSSDGDFSWLPYFQPEVNRLVLPTTFSRKLKIMTRVEALKHWQKFLQIMQRMVTTVPDIMRDIESLMDFFEAFGSGEGCVLTRSFAQLVLLPHDQNIFGVYPLSEIIFDTIKRLDSIISADNPEIALLSDSSLEDSVDTFVSYCEKAFVGVFQTLGQNLARQRDKLIRNCLEDFGLLQIEALEIEERRSKTIRENSKAEDGKNSESLANSASSPLSNFVLFYVLRLMKYHFHLGFRLELFMPNEFPYIYWYMGEIVSNHLTSILERRCSLIVLNYSKSVAAIELRKKANKKRQLKQRAEENFHKNIGHMQMDIFRHKVSTHLCRAFAKFTCALQVASGRRMTPDEYAQEQLRYHQRFGEFAALPIMPTLLNVPYELYRSTSGIDQLMSEYNAEDIFAQAHAHFEEAVAFMKSIEPHNGFHTTDMPRLMKNFKHNAIVAKLLSKNVKKKVVFENLSGGDPAFLLIKLV